MVWPVPLLLWKNPGWIHYSLVLAVDKEDAFDVVASQPPPPPPPFEALSEANQFFPRDRGLRGTAARENRKILDSKEYRL
jgi:hypothetical protein